MTYPPFQMNQAIAANYCSVSVNHFKKLYRPKIKHIVEEGGTVSFLRTDLEKFMQKRSKESATWPSEKRNYQASIDTKMATGILTKTSTDTDAFTEAVARQTTSKQNAELFVGLKS